MIGALIPVAMRIYRSRVDEDCTPLVLGESAMPRTAAAVEELVRLPEMPG